MARRYYTIISFILLILPLFSCQNKKDGISDIPRGEFWIKQGTDQVLDSWTRHAMDSSSGIFYTFLDREWNPYKGNVIHPGMISRHVFSYSVGYLLTGEEKYLERASGIVDYLLENGWDREYGGWFNALDRKGNIVDSAKDGFLQPYAITGLTMYYFVTHDKEVLEYIEQSNRIMEKYAWDSIYGGYYRSLNRDLSVQETDKDFSPQLAPVSGYLIYLYLTTGYDVYLEQMEKIINTVIDSMSMPGEPWILERFDRSWNYTQETRADSTEINTGHNIEVVWMLLRLYELTGNENYLKKARDLQEPLYTFGVSEDTGIWYQRLGRTDPAHHNNSSPWWIQAYGNMLSLYLYYATGKDRYLEVYQKGAGAWNRFFIDDEYGGAFLTVNIDGSVEKGSKAVRSKTSYHSLEHAMLNYIYTNLWVMDKPVKLHFYIEEPGDGEKLYPVPVETGKIKIGKIKINGELWTEFNAGGKFIRLPASGEMKIEVLIENKK